MIRSNLCDYSDAYILAKGTVTVSNTAAAGKAVNNTNEKVNLKIVLEINNTQVGDARKIDVVMPMSN